MAINLDFKYDKEKKREQKDVWNEKRKTLNVRSAISSAQSFMKDKVNQIYHLQESVGKQVVLCSSSGAKTVTQFEIESIFEKGNERSQLKHALQNDFLIDQRDKIKNTYSFYGIKTNKFEPDDILPHSKAERKKQRPSTGKFTGNFFLTNCKTESTNKKEKPDNLPKFNYSSKSLIDQQGEVIHSHSNSLRTISIGKDTPNKPNLPFGRLSESHHISRQGYKKKQISFASPRHNTQSQSSVNVNTLQMTAPDSDVLSVSNQSTRLAFNSQQSYLHNHLQSSLNIKAFNSSQIQNELNFKTQDLGSLKNWMEENQRQETKQDQILLEDQLIQQNYENAMQDDQNQADDEKLLSSDYFMTQKQVSCFNDQGNSNLIKREDSVKSNSPSPPPKNNEYEDAISSEFIPPMKQVYYIDNNEMQSVKEFMYRVHKYDQFKRFEQKRLDRERKKEQIVEVQKMLLYQSEKAAREIARSSVRRFVMRHQLKLTEDEMENWVQKIIIKPLETNQRLTFRETSKQIVSFQLRGSDEEKDFFKIQKQIDIALNKINRPVKFAQQFQVFQNHKALKFQTTNKFETHNLASIALINRLPSQYLVDPPPSSFFNQVPQSVSKLKSMASFKIEQSKTRISKSKINTSPEIKVDKNHTFHNFEKNASATADQEEAFKKLNIGDINLKRIKED